MPFKFNGIFQEQLNRENYSLLEIIILHQIIQEEKLYIKLNDGAYKIKVKII